MKTLLACLLLSTGLCAQGVHFEEGKWSDIKAKAKAENKYIFMDAYTTWCGPCKYMANTVFPKAEMGEFFNANFVNASVQLDTTAKDNDYVKSWYADAHEIMTKYNVNAFPTFLVFDPNGQLVHRIVGAADADKFIPKAKIALDPNQQYYTLLNKYNAGKKDQAFIKQLALAALDAYDMKQVEALHNQYVDGMSGKLSADDIEFITKTTTKSTDKGFNLMLKNQAAFDKVNGEGTTSSRMVDMVMRGEVRKTIFASKDKAPDWKALQQDLTAKYPALAEEIVATAKVAYYQSKKDWSNFQQEIVSYMKKYGSKATESELNSYAWTVFENCPDMRCVEEALDWSKRSFEKNNNPMFMDTYANILYKMGKKQEAIDWETKALALAPDSEKGSYQETVDKMKKGEKTWNN